MAAAGSLQRPHRHDPALDLLIQRGEEHERAYVAYLGNLGLEIADLSDCDENTGVERTRQAMQQGVDIIVQANLRHVRWHGRADILQKTENTSSNLGDWSYEAVDTKLTRQTRGGTVLQLSLYSDLLGEAQGRAPQQFYVVKPSRDAKQPFEEEPFRCSDYSAYYRLVRLRLEERLDSASEETTYPTPVAHCDICPWWSTCNHQRRNDDHLSFVAGLQTLHHEELNRQGITTLAAFAARDKPLDEPPTRGSRDTFDRLHGQAKIQLEGRQAEAPRYAMLPVEAERGLTRLPQPSTGDVFFDIESDPFVEPAGLEYLFGYVIFDDKGRPEYHRTWATTASEEKRMFEDFMDFLMERWEHFPDFHVYHFAPYEPSALKRLMGRHASREDELDRLLRAGRLIDLLAATRQGIRASVESYSLKALEPFFGFERDVALPDARAALRALEYTLESRASEAIDPTAKQAVEGYNQDDCLSTLELRDWLEKRRSELIAAGNSVSRPELQDGEASEHLAERRAEVQEVFDRLVDGLPEDHDTWTQTERGRFLLAHLLDYFRREAKCNWWELFRLSDLEHDDLFGERKAVSGLEFLTVEGGTSRCPVHRYRFPAQEVAVSLGDRVFTTGEPLRIGTVHAVNAAARTLDIKKAGDHSDLHPVAVVAHKNVSAKPIEQSLLALASSVAEHGLDGAGPFRAARDLLLQHPPRLQGIENGDASLRRTDEPTVEAAIRLARALEHSYLPIQGPPGTGKTYTGGRMIALLRQQNQRIGVTAVSHKVIRNLLDAAIKAGGELGISVEAVHKVRKPDPDEETEHLQQVTKNPQVVTALDEGKVAGGTCWLWSSNDAVEQLDYLFIDEAGQLSLAMMLAAARSAKNLILLGDPQQLEQPQQASHPEGTAVSALEHVLRGEATLAKNRGLFLDTTWRLHPSICDFTSDVYYESRLKAREGLERQAIDGTTRFRGSGIFFESVEHRGNQSRSDEEIHYICEIVGHLRSSETVWINDENIQRPLVADDILVIAPYNAQVAALIEALPTNVRVGTVDKFQGQEAPIVIYSMTSSSAEDAPRGMTFLYNPNRLNVATSRACGVCIVVASPALLETECRTPTQMRWANALCRLRELSG